MDVLTIIITLIIVLVCFEVSKHIVLKTFVKSIAAIIIISFAFLFILGAMGSENEIDTNNQIIQTGAVIVEEIQELDYVENTIDKMKDYISDFGK